MQDHLQNGESIRYRSTSVEQAWRKRADLQVRLCVLRGDPGYPSSLRPESDSRQTDNVDRQQNQDTRGLNRLIPHISFVVIGFVLLEKLTKLFLKRSTPMMLLLFRYV